jgi:sulfane dehydrogenase subunit SoxC
MKNSEKPNRRRFLRNGAALAGLAAGGGSAAEAQTQGTPAKKLEELIAYGERSRFVTSKRASVADSHSPDEFGLTFHVLTPLQDQFGIITPSSLFYTATHRGAFVPDIDPAEHRLKVTMPNREGFALPPTWKPGEPRLPGYAGQGR